MKYFGDGLSELHKELNAIIRTKAKTETAKKLFLDLHAKVHLSQATDTGPNEVDDLLNDLSDGEYRVMPTAKDETIAWSLWHLARIEDITMNDLVAEEDQVFDENWKKEMNAPISDTGNALTDDEIMNFSKMLHINTLIAYRNAVGKRTQEIVKHFSELDWKRKVSSKRIDKIKKTGGVTAQKDSLWLLDYWGKKDVAGLLLMPPTRHAILHLNDCAGWKNHIRNGKKCFRTH